MPFVQAPPQQQVAERETLYGTPYRDRQRCAVFRIRAKDRRRFVKKFFSKEEVVALKLMGYGPVCTECTHWVPSQAKLLGKCDLREETSFQTLECRYVRDRLGRELHYVDDVKGLCSECKHWERDGDRCLGKCHGGHERSFANDSCMDFEVKDAPD
jgi:hypothetical protein